MGYKKEENASQGSFADAAEFGEIIFNCTKGEHSIEALESAGKENLSSKNFSKCFQPIGFFKGNAANFIFSK